MLRKTEYTLLRHGEEFEIEIYYQYKEAANDRFTDSMVVESTSPLMNFTDEEMEEIELQCWTDVVISEGRKVCDATLQPHPLTKQYIPEAFNV